MEQFWNHGETFESPCGTSGIPCKTKSGNPCESLLYICPHLDILGIFILTVGPFFIEILVLIKKKYARIRNMHVIMVRIQI